MFMREEMESLGEQIAAHAAHLDAAMHDVLSEIRTFDTGGGWGFAGATSCAHWLSWRVGWDLGTARERVRVAHRLVELPLVDDGLRTGALSYSKARAITRVATPENEALLVQCALCSTAAQLEKICRKYRSVQRAAGMERDEEQARRVVTRRNLDCGLTRIEATLRPEEAALVWAAIEQAAKRVSAETFDRADGLCALARGEQAPFEVVVTIDASALAGDDDAPGELADGTGVSAETCRRLTCDGGVVEMHVGNHGQPLNVGRRTRSIPTAILRALNHRDDTCRFPGCTNRVFTEGHHIEHWALGGETSLWNLVRLCTQHHPLVHEHGWRVELDEHQQPRFYDPCGRLVDEVPKRAAPIRPHFADVSAETNVPQWDGRPVQYGAVIDALVSADGLNRQSTDSTVTTTAR
jgi:hypothetical protein